MSPAAVASNLIAEKERGRREARRLRLASPKVMLCLRVAAQAADALDAAAKAAGETIDQYVERRVREGM